MACFDDDSENRPAESEEQFWHDLKEILCASCTSFEHIDDTLRSWLNLVATCRDQYLGDEDDIATCSQQLIESSIFASNREYVRTQIIYSLLQEDEAGPLHIIANFLLLDGRSDEDLFRRMIDEGCFTRLVELISARRDEDRRLHRLLLELMYEMSRVERVGTDDLLHVDDKFVAYLFRLIESLSDDVDDPYHYPIIRVLLVLNEQYMVAATTAATDRNTSNEPLTNRVIKLLSLHGPAFRTFGENIILLLNRETETSLQLLILKLLYLLFTTRATYEYFYTNDLRVLLDVIIRNLLDLPNDSSALRHTYLRVLYPLLAHTQLCNPPHYKKDEIVKVMRLLSGAGNVHFAPADETTMRLVDRVSKVKWLVDETEEAPQDKDGTADSPASGGSGGKASLAKRFLGISLGSSEAASKISVVDIAAVTEKPGIQTPSRRKVAAAAAEEHAVQRNNGVGSEDADGRASSPASSAACSPVLGGDDGPMQPLGKKPRPAVPRHRHGIRLKPLPTVVVTGSPGPANGNGKHNEAVSPAANSGNDPNGDGNGAKKPPPKAPPPRRSKLRNVSSKLNIKESSAAVS